MQITWDDFKLNSHGTDGIRLRFEDLCRLLFINENISGNKQFRYLHANPNNPGLETEPIYDEVNKRNIGFQAKFFETNVDYSQIEHSAGMTVKHYAGKVDHVFLFCNKPLTSRSLTKTVDILKNANIELELVTDKAILDLVELRYPYLAPTYFGGNTFDMDWIRTHSGHMFDELGERYDRVFNVETQFSIELSLFVHDQRAADYINEKKQTLLKEIERIYWNRDIDRPYLNTLKKEVSTFSDVNIETLFEAIVWKESLEKATDTYLEKYNKERFALENDRKKQHDIVFSVSGNKAEHEKELRKYQELSAQIRTIDELVNLPAIVEITKREQQLLRGNKLFVLGRAGIGKSQLLAYETSALLSAGREALLLLSGTYFTTDPIHIQIMNNLRLDYSVDDLLDILESIGERSNRIVPVFIDALNETWNKRLWKVGLDSIFEKMNTCPMVKIVVSYRPEYETLVLSDSVMKMKESSEILTMYHRGFEDNSIQAAKEFMNHYGISFTPLEFFGYEMSNPLFLTLYCKTYNGEEVSLPQLYERLIQGANVGIFKALEEELTKRGYTADDNIIRSLVDEIAYIMVEKKRRSITYQELCDLRFWSYHQLAPAVFVKHLINEHILHETVINEDEIHYYFAYDQMNDYYCAKTIVKKFLSKKELRRYLSEIVLGIQDGELGNSWNIDLFVNACALYAEKFGEECIDIIDNLLDNYDKWSVFSRYIDSFQWRDKRFIPADKIYDFLMKYPCEPGDLWKMLIGNSVKVSHPLNADFLHRFLLSYLLSKRDQLWTIYINGLTWDDADRIVQLIQMYNAGEKLEISDEKQVELLLTLFGWLLTSSNRWLRDYTSKAMIEILKEHFELCQTILEKFKDVNDPYVIQRLHGVVFGACCKRTSNDTMIFRELAGYVYTSVFNQDKVYPDILLRDYARMIIESFLHENLDYDGDIDRDKISPPYNSDPIPEIEDQHYLDGEYDGGLLWLVNSMRFENMGMYGDFGRYVFQSALHDFEVDDKEIFNYAVYYILNDLGYNEDYFSDYDRHCSGYDRTVTAKTERIGKKYQWIAMYNILARVSDHYEMIDRWSFPEKRDIQYEGAWAPYVRDFDPTLNKHFMICPYAPVFNEIDEFIVAGREENEKKDLSNFEKSTAWLEDKGYFFKELKNTLMLRDASGVEWVSLTKYVDTGRRNIAEDKLLVWSWLYAYFVKPEQKKAFRETIERGDNIITDSVNSHHQTYSIFNREYPWAPSCQKFNEEAWLNISLPTYEKRTVNKTYQMPDIDAYKELIARLGYSSSSENPDSIVLFEEKDSDDGFEIPYKDIIVEHEIKKDIGMILYSTSELIWEEEYDASKDEALCWSVPCAEIIESLGLEQKEYDGFYYDSNGNLAAFDTQLTQGSGGVVIRKNLLDEFLSKNEMDLIWIVQGGKEIHESDLHISRWSDWEALYEYDSGKLTDNLRFMGVKR